MIFSNETVTLMSIINRTSPSIFDVALVPLLFSAACKSCRRGCFWLVVCHGVYSIILWTDRECTDRYD